MTTHLSPPEFVDAIEGVLAAAGQRHLETCDECRREVFGLATLMDGVQATVEVPEPSPLFWEHLSRRVRAATDGDAIQPRAGWLNGSWVSSFWRPLLTMTAVAAVALVTLVVLVHSPAATEDGGVSTLAALPLGLDDTSAAQPATPPDDAMDFVAQYASDVPWDDLRQVAQPTRDVTAAALDQLTPAQRAAFARMIKAAMGGVE